MQGFADRVAVVTGAGSGIGQALAVELGRAGAKLAISDVDTAGLAQTEEQLKAIGAAVTAFARNASVADGLNQADLANLFEEQQAKTSPQRAAQVILEAVRKNKSRVLVGPDVKAMDLVVRLTGSGYERLLGGPVMGRVRNVVTRLMPKR